MEEKPIRKRKKIRTNEECLQAIYMTLKLSEYPLTTSQVAVKVNLSHKSTLANLNFLEFQDKVVHFERGSGSWKYWKIKR